MQRKCVRSSCFLSKRRSNLRIPFALRGYPAQLHEDKRSPGRPRSKIILADDFEPTWTGYKPFASLQTGAKLWQSVYQTSTKRYHFGAETNSKTQSFPTGLAEYLYPLSVPSSTVSKPSPVAGTVPRMIFHLAPTLGL